MDPNAGQEPTGTDDGQEPIANPQAGAASVSGSDNGAAPQAGDDVSKKVKKANEEAARYRVQVRDLEAKIKAFEDAQKTQEQRDQEELTRLRALDTTARDAIRAANRRAAIALAAADADTVDRSLLTMLVDRAELDVDPETGAPTADSLKEAITSILAEKPYLVKQAAQSQPQPKATSAGSGTNLPRTKPLTVESIAQMSEDEVNANWEAVQAVLRMSSPVPARKTPHGNFAYLEPMNGE